MVNRTGPTSIEARGKPLGDTGDGKTGVPVDEQGISNRPGDGPQSNDPQEEDDEDEDDGIEDDDDDDLEEDEDDEVNDPEAEPGKPI
jgi:hypothetical protein